MAEQRDDDKPVTPPNPRLPAKFRHSAKPRRLHSLHRTGLNPPPQPALSTVSLMVPQTRLQQMFPTVIPRRKSRPPSFSNPSRRLLRRNRQPCKCRLPSSRLRRHIKFRAINR